MNENFLKSRLKRKKSTVEELHLETTSGGTPKRSYATLLSSNNLAETEGSVLPAVAWWNRQQLLAGESLWAFTLKAALPYLEETFWDLVPDLPHTSAARPVLQWLEEQGWSDLNSEVSTFPEPSHPSPRSSQSPDPIRLSSSQQGLSPYTNAVRGLSSHSKQSPTHKIMSPQPLSKTQQEEAVSSSSNAKREEGRKGSLPVSRQLLTYWVKVSERVPQQKEVEQKKEDEAGRCGTTDAGRELQSCPMCLQVFPAVFTQMDCDGHLAQCLSEMNVDMTW